MKPKLIFNWSSGKDSALCLYKLWQANEYEITCLLTSISETYQRVSMHGVRVELLEQQAKSIGIPLIKMEIPEQATMEVYEKAVTDTLTPLINQGSSISAFGDIFLEDLRQYREQKLAELNLKAIFPLWKIPTDQLVRECIDLGFKAVITCVNEKYLDKSFAGRIIDHDFINDLPANVDPCGENGEFHSFVYDGPIFSQPVLFSKGDIVHRTYTSPEADSGFWYCDLIPDL